MSLIEGYLLKQGDAGIVKKWRRRYFEMNHGRGRGPALFYFEKKGDIKEKGFIDFTTVNTVNSLSQSLGIPCKKLKDRAYEFHVISPNRVYRLRANDEAEMNYWVEALSKYLSSKSSGNGVSGAEHVLNDMDAKYGALSEPSQDVSFASSASSLQKSAPKGRAASEVILKDAEDMSDNNIARQSMIVPKSAEQQAKSPAPRRYAWDVQDDPAMQKKGSPETVETASNGSDREYTFAGSDWRAKLERDSEQIQPTPDLSSIAAKENMAGDRLSSTGTATLPIGGSMSPVGGGTDLLLVDSMSKPATPDASPMATRQGLGQAITTTASDRERSASTSDGVSESQKVSDLLTPPDRRRRSVMPDSFQSESTRTKSLSPLVGAQKSMSNSVASQACGKDGRKSQAPASGASNLPSALPLERPKFKGVDQQRDEYIMNLEDEMKALRAENDALSRDIKSLMVNSGGVMRVQDHEKKRREAELQVTKERLANEKRLKQELQKKYDEAKEELRILRTTFQRFYTEEEHAAHKSQQKNSADPLPLEISPDKSQPAASHLKSQVSMGLVDVTQTSQRKSTVSYQPQPISGLGVRKMRASDFDFVAPDPQPSSARGSSASNSVSPLPLSVSAPVASQGNEDNFWTRPPALWMKDETQPNCIGCRKNFSIFLRRHHCRCCGKVYCGDCSSWEIVCPGYPPATPQRVCLPCCQLVQSKLHVHPNKRQLKVPPQLRALLDT